MYCFLNWKFFVVLMVVALFLNIFDIDKQKNIYSDPLPIDKEESDSNYKDDTNKFEFIVYLTNTGNCYHKLGCKYLNSIRDKLSLEDAKKQGYRACSYCF